MLQGGNTVCFLLLISSGARQWTFSSYIWLRSIEPSMAFQSILYPRQHINSSNRTVFMMKKTRLLESHRHFTTLKRNIDSN